MGIVVNLFGEIDEEGALEVQFERFWGVYPRRTGKGAARKSFERALRRASMATIMRAAIAYRDDPARKAGHPKFTPMPATWLNQERWADEPPPTIAPKPPEPRLSPLGPRESCGSCDAGWLFADDGSVKRCPTCG